MGIEGIKRRNRARNSVFVDLFGQPPTPDGFQYIPGFISEDAERSLAHTIATLDLKEFEFQGFKGKRRVVSFGWRYEFDGGGLTRAEPIPDFLRDVERSAEDFAGLPSDGLQQVLITEYSPGAAIGWHKDRPVFGTVVGISLLSACTFRFRRGKERGWDRFSIAVEPRSAYLLDGPSRTEWEHSIPSVEHLRYSLTFRSLKQAPRQ